MSRIYSLLLKTIRAPADHKILPDGPNSMRDARRAATRPAVKLWCIRALLVVLAVGQVGDVLTTNHALAASPGAFEANPLMHLLMTYLGSWWWLWKAAVGFFFIAMAIGMRQVSRRQLIFAGALAKVYVLVLLNNLLQ
jgi:hypothetical protein